VIASRGNAHVSGTVCHGRTSTIFVVDAPVAIGLAAGAEQLQATTDPTLAAAARASVPTVDPAEIRRP